MPYSNIVYIKLFLELFDGDDRFLYRLTERQQLLYIKLLYLAGRQVNKISKNPQLIIQKVNYQGTTQDLLGDIEVIKNVFKKFRESKYTYTFFNFQEIHNFMGKGKSKGTPEERQRIVPDKDKDKEKIKSIKQSPDGSLVPVPTEKKKTIVDLYCLAFESHFKVKPFLSEKGTIAIPKSEVMALQRILRFFGEVKARGLFTPDESGRIPIFTDDRIKNDNWIQENVFSPNSLEKKLIKMKNKQNIEVANAK